MRRLVGLLIVGACVAGAALAEVPGETPIQSTEFLATFEDQGSRHPMYPREALEREQNGDAALCCVADERRRLTCQTISEAPTRRGFARESLRYSDGLRLTEASYAELQRLGGEMRLEISFSLDPTQHIGDIQIETSAVCESVPLS